MKNNKTTKIATTVIASLVIGLMISSPMTILPNISAQTTPQSSQDQAIFDKIRQNMPQELSKSDSSKALQIALSDTHVQSLISGKSIVLTNQGFTGNIYANPIVWNPTFNIAVDNKTQLVIVVDSANNRVIDVSQGPVGIKLIGDSGKRSFAIDYYGGTNQPQGLEMSSNAVTFTPNSAYSFTAFLNNGVMSGSNDADLCVTGATDAYWMQAGFLFDSNTNAKTVWTDTAHGCSAQTTSVSYVSGHSYKFYIFGDSVARKWTAEVIDSTSGTSFIQTTSGQSSFILKTIDSNNGVFFENSNTVQGSSTWNTQFSSFPFATALRESSGSWINWDAEIQREDTFCHGFVADTVISQDMLNGDTATWNLTTMAANYPAC